MDQDPRHALDEVERQRIAMASRIRLPWWFLLLFALTWATLLAGPTLSRDHARLDIPAFPYAFVAFPALMVLLIGFRRRSGLHLIVRSREYPSLKRHIGPTVAILLGGAAVVWGLDLLDLPWGALACAVLAGCLAAVQMWRVNTGIRSDILEDGYGCPIR